MSSIIVRFVAIRCLGPLSTSTCRLGLRLALSTRGTRLGRSTTFAVLDYQKTTSKFDLNVKKKKGGEVRDVKQI
jgi:hypothetical protein